jgi:cytoskeleton bundling-enhancing protein CbeA-like protein
VTPLFGARLVQEGHNLHFLADRAGFSGVFSESDARHLDQAFPLFMKQMEGMLLSGELEPRRAKGITLQAKELTVRLIRLAPAAMYISPFIPLLSRFQQHRTEHIRSLFCRADFHKRGPGCRSCSRLFQYYPHYHENTVMKKQPVSPTRVASCCLSPAEVWRTLLTHLLAQHYGLTLSDTPFARKTPFRRILKPVFPWRRP